jgi:hypothetical protein
MPLNNLNFYSSYIKNKLEDLSAHIEVTEYTESSPSMANIIIDESINNIDGNTNILLYELLTTAIKELKSLYSLYSISMYGSELPLSEAEEQDNNILNTLINAELNNKDTIIDYQALNYDIKIVSLIASYIQYLGKFSGSLIADNYILENNIAPLDKNGKSLLALNYENVVKLLRNSKYLLEQNFNTRLVLNRFKRVYNLRTELLELYKKIEDKEYEKYKKYLMESKYKLAVELKEALIDLSKAIQTQYICLDDLEREFKQKCDLLYILKGSD